jgi:hypothetical protein
MQKEILKKNNLNRNFISKKNLRIIDVIENQLNRFKRATLPT